MTRKLENGCDRNLPEQRHYSEKCRTPDTFSHAVIVASLPIYRAMVSYAVENSSRGIDLLSPVELSGNSRAAIAIFVSATMVPAARRSVRDTPSSAAGLPLRHRHRGAGDTAKSVGSVVGAFSCCSELTAVPSAEPRKSTDSFVRALTKLSVESSERSRKCCGRIRPRLTSRPSARSVNDTQRAS